MQISLKELGITAEKEKSVLVIDEEKLAQSLYARQCQILLRSPQWENLPERNKNSFYETAKHLSQNAKSFMRIVKDE